MAKIEQFKCDGCGKLRTDDANHWWVVLTDATGSTDPRRLALCPLTVLGSRDGFNAWDFCGQQCALAFISAQMAGGK